ncbi:MAG: Gfo/Idh/MocA family oxidoreductase [Gemmatales bacterium]|nr:Gfo/Idh/MocA family oxidoreductase [Gemmatales bacterium]MDW8221806.1 Gfo/Idh/MocA family oxidoreductase [Gemmatales bacterium]
MASSTRRTFLESCGALALGTALSSRGWAAPSQRIVVGIIGTGGMGLAHLRSLARRNDVSLAYVCDVDANRLAQAAREAAKLTGSAPKAVKDLRHILDDRQVDAVFLATPDHWHAPAALLALQAGKHVYVEKPMTHNIREGRLLIEAVRQSGKCLQVGTQSRSTAMVREAIERVRQGEIGEVLVAKAWNSQLRRSIGKSQPTSPPPHLDFDLWVGPAPMVPYRPNLLHGVWRWWWDFGCGDIGNDGVHDIDLALWGLGVETHPHTVTCLGGKYFFDDDQQWPDTQYAVFEYRSAGRSGRTKQLIYEQRIWSPYVQEGYENGAAFYGTQGMLLIGHTVGWKLFGPRNRLIAERSGSVDLPAHHTNFLECIRGNQKSLHADVHSGHLAATICHLANIALRLGRLLHFQPDKEQFVNDTEADSLVRRRYREGHWAVPRGV